MPEPPRSPMEPPSVGGRRPTPAAQEPLHPKVGPATENSDRAIFWRIFRMFGGPFGQIMADLGLSRRHGWILAGRKMPNGVPTGP